MLVAGWLLQEEALNWQASFKARPPTEAIIFILGGSTYEEAKVRRQDHVYMMLRSGASLWCWLVGPGVVRWQASCCWLWLEQLREAVMWWG